MVSVWELGPAVCWRGGHLPVLGQHLANSSGFKLCIADWSASCQDDVSAMRTHMIALPTRAHTPQGDSCWHLGASVSNFSLEQTVSPDQPKKLHPGCRHCPGETGQLWIWGFGGRCLLGAALPQQPSQRKILVKSVWAVLSLSWKTTFSGCDCQKMVQLELLYHVYLY